VRIGAGPWESSDGGWRSATAAGRRRNLVAGFRRSWFLGVPTSGNQVAIDGMDIMQSRDEMAVAHWVVTDMAGMMAHIGAGPG
jgi:hypothetical protein